MSLGSSQTGPLFGIQQSLHVVKDESGTVTVTGLFPGQLMRIFNTCCCQSLIVHVFVAVSWL